MAVAREVIRVDLAQGVLHRGVQKRQAELRVPTGFDELALGAFYHESTLEVALAVFQRLALQADDVSTLTVGDNARLLFGLCKHLHGETIDLLTTCPHCSEPSEMTVAFEDLMTTATEIDGRFELGGGWCAELRSPTLDDIAKVAQAEKQSRTLVEACIVQLVAPSGSCVSPTELPPDLEAKVAECLEAMDPASETISEITCPACDAQFEAEIDAMTLLRKKLCSRNSLLGEVFRMARTYHWSEADILNLPIERRRTYLLLAETAMGTA